jgi:hypothetical protein
MALRAHLRLIMLYPQNGRFPQKQVTLTLRPEPEEIFYTFPMDRKVIRVLMEQSGKARISLVI